MTRADLEQRLADVAAASAAVLADQWAALAGVGERRRYALLRLHVEAALVAFLDAPGAGEWPFPPAWEPPEPSRN